MDTRQLLCELSIKPIYLLLYRKKYGVHIAVKTYDCSFSYVNLKLSETKTFRDRSKIVGKLVTDGSYRGNLPTARIIITPYCMICCAQHIMIAVDFTLFFHSVPVTCLLVLEIGILMLINISVLAHIQMQNVKTEH